MNHQRKSEIKVRGKCSTRPGSVVKMNGNGTRLTLMHTVNPKDQAQTVFSFGYQGHTVCSMIRVLNSNEISLLVDVRQNPISRKPGFGKSRLKPRLAEAGIEYVHYPCLGTPNSIRSRYCRNGQISLALKEYEKYLSSRLGCLQSLIESTRGKRFCLLCFENDYNSCHRGVIARKLEEMVKCQTTHLK